MRIRASSGTEQPEKHASKELEPLKVRTTVYEHAELLEETTYMKALRSS